MKNSDLLLKMFNDSKSQDQIIIDEVERKRLEDLTLEEVICGLIPDWMDDAYEEGSVYKLPCVFHQNVRTPRGTLALDFFNNRFNCHSCQAGGTGGFNFARNLALREEIGDFAQHHISQEDYLSPDILNKTFEKLASIEHIYLSAEQRLERKRNMKLNLAREQKRKMKGRYAAKRIYIESFPFPSGKILEEHPNWVKSSAYHWGTKGQKANCVDYSRDYPNIRMTKRLWRGYENPEAVGCIIAPLCQIKDWVETLITENKTMPVDKVGSVHMIAINSQGDKANNLGLNDLAKKDNKYKIGRKLNDGDNSVFMLSGESDKPLIICEGLGDALALHKLYNCYVMTPIGVIGKLSKHSREIVEFCIQFCSNEIWLMPDNDAGLNLISRFVQELKRFTLSIEIKTWLLKEKIDTLDPADVVMYNTDQRAREIFREGLSIKKRDRLSDILRSNL